MRNEVGGALFRRQVGILVEGWRGCLGVEEGCDGQREDKAADEGVAAESGHVFSKCIAGDGGRSRAASGKKAFLTLPPFRREMAQS